MWKCKCGEMNPDSSSFCQSCGNKKASSVAISEEKLKLQQKIAFEEAEKRKIEAERKNREQIQQDHSQRIENLSNMGLDGYYEYKVISLNDTDSGGIYPKTIEDTLNNLGLEGWHLRCAYTNELGKNSNSSGFGGFSTGTNSTIDQNILIFERFVRINK